MSSIAFKFTESNEFLQAVKQINMRFLFYIFSLCIFLSSCQGIQIVKEEVKRYDEPYRPQFHFSPEYGWMNDPNGMVYYEGEYHLFYQYYPDSTVWGPMHWGHAISEDLVHWEHLPIALFPDENGLIFSGSAVVDWQNTSGFGQKGKPPLVAIFSYHNMELEISGVDTFQTQGIAFSNDKGRTWTKYEGNPVIKNPGIRDFRDPKVIWHKETNKWIMAVAALDHLNFYGSPDLKTWELISEFGKEIGSHDGVWECPDLFQLQADDGTDYWVLIENMNPGNPNGGSGTQYFIGQFDGREFTVDKAFSQLLASKPEVVPLGEVLEDFEQGYANWDISGTAFGEMPSDGALPNQSSVNGFKGNKFANSYTNGDKSTGTLISKPFIIDKNAINFLLGGGNHRGKTFIGLKVEGAYVRQTEGKNNESLKWTGWNVERFIGKEATIEIVDNYEGGWGHINVDHIMFADVVASSEESGSVWLDSGMDNYAGVTWSDVPESDGRRIFMGWMSNWAYAQVVPTKKWRSAMTIPWSLSIKQINGIPRLIGNPVKELDQLAVGEWTEIASSSTSPESNLYELDITVSDLEAQPFQLVLSNNANEQISFTLNDDVFSFDRTKGGDHSFSSDFSGVHRVQRISQKKELRIHAFVDQSSIELFLDDGLNVFTELFYPSEPYQKIKLEGNVEAKIREIKRIW